ncbi:MAG TPA: protease inhibitor I42 family protein [Acetobacteraceae bacterium]|nr:protease inhibitor I42 family protein [Acetobacteraceae bacterium]
MLEIDRSQNGGTVEVQTGETFRLHLSENPTTGYRWYVALPADAVLRVVDDSFEKLHDNPGAGGMRHWTFAADRPGVVRLQFDRKRAWETQAAESFTVTIDVKAR